MLKFLELLGAPALSILEKMGKMVLFFCSFLSWSVRPPFKIRHIVKQLHFIGAKSFFIILPTAFFTGGVLALQGFNTLQNFGGEGLLGALVALGIIRELGPVLAALMVTARAGSAITAEIGIMKITEQIDALKTMAVDPIKFVVVPKIIAGIIALPLLTAMFDLIGIWGGYAVGVHLLGVNEGSYFGEIKSNLDFEDITGGFWKSVSFGLLITWFACYEGYHAGHGAEGVGRATTNSVVITSVSILVWDYFMTSILL